MRTTTRPTGGRARSRNRQMNKFAAALLIFTCALSAYGATHHHAKSPSPTPSPEATWTAPTPMTAYVSPAVYTSPQPQATAQGYAGVILLFAAYFAPGIVASARHHHNAGAIWCLTLFLGWSVLGWIIALVWAFTAVRPRTT
jgi:hypothetical protein